MQFKKKNYHIKQKYSKKILFIIKLSTKYMNVFAIGFTLPFLGTSIFYNQFSPYKQYQQIKFCIQIHTIIFV